MYCICLLISCYNILSLVFLSILHFYYFYHSPIHTHIHTLMAAAAMQGDFDMQLSSARGSWNSDIWILSDYDYTLLDIYCCDVYIIPNCSKNIQTQKIWNFVQCNGLIWYPCWYNFQENITWHIMWKTWLNIMWIKLKHYLVHEHFCLSSIR